MTKSIYIKTVEICMIIHELVNRGLIEEATRTLKDAGFIHKSQLLDEKKLKKIISDELGLIGDLSKIICSNLPIKEIK